jgi:outer membrane protein
MKGISRNLRFCCLALALSFALGAQAQALKVGVFDAQAVSENSEMGKRIQAELEAFTDSKEAQIAQRQEKVAVMRKDLSQQSLSLSPDKRAMLEKDIQRLMLELQSFQESASRELELEYGSATNEFRDKLVATVASFGNDEGFSVILDRSQVAWAAAGIDVTSAVIDRFNSMYPVAQETGD